MSQPAVTNQPAAAITADADAILAKPGKPKPRWIYQSGDEMHPVAVFGVSKLFAIDDRGVISANSRQFDLDEFLFEGVDLEGGYHGRPTNSGRRIVLKTGGNTLSMTPGASCLLGAPKSGKTLFSKVLVTRNPELVKVIRYREPEDDSLFYEASLVREFWTALRGDSDVIFIDSLRTTFYAAGGTTGKGGVNMGTFGLMTAFDLIARAFNKTVIFALNPMTTNESDVEFYLSAANGSVTHTIHALSPLSLAFSSRAGDRSDVPIKYAASARATDDPTSRNLRTTDFIEPEDGISDLYATTSR